MDSKRGYVACPRRAIELLAGVAHISLTLSARRMLWTLSSKMCVAHEKNKAVRWVVTFTRNSTLVGKNRSSILVSIVIFLSSLRRPCQCGQSGHLATVTGQKSFPKALRAVATLVDHNGLVRPAHRRQKATAKYWATHPSCRVLTLILWKQGVSHSAARPCFRSMESLDRSKSNPPSFSYFSSRSNLLATTKKTSIAHLLLCLSNVSIHIGRRLFSVITPTVHGSRCWWLRNGARRRNDRNWI